MSSNSNTTPPAGNLDVDVVLHILSQSPDMNTLLNLAATNRFMRTLALTTVVPAYISTHPWANSTRFSNRQGYVPINDFIMNIVRNHYYLVFRLLSMEENYGFLTGVRCGPTLLYATTVAVLFHIWVHQSVALPREALQMIRDNLGVARHPAFPSFVNLSAMDLMERVTVLSRGLPRPTQTSADSAADEDLTRKEVGGKKLPVVGPKSILGHQPNCQYLRQRHVPKYGVSTDRGVAARVSQHRVCRPFERDITEYNSKIAFVPEHAGGSRQSTKAAPVEYSQESTRSPYLHVSVKNLHKWVRSKRGWGRKRARNGRRQWPFHWPIEGSEWKALDERSRHVNPHRFFTEARSSLLI
ncbi:hypothetical protein PLICRDRAFT_32867 [Plicaturopsis crispa FD-325 SS-3]|uniref:F-box domain-containing protein n=1 Tax=Plicaturopsis crispa FD-325 SS-3 TaxID=944288 RepID=A0A0C9SW60_PLICR|nr:hypothetical protein PLICRDRAFT_32867 [Plicaturopsis crispa FD-325 SS-3]